MKENLKYESLRKEIRRILRRFCQLGVVVVPNERELGVEALNLLSKMFRHEEIASSQHEIYFDEGLFASVKQGEELANGCGGYANCKLYFEQDSKVIAGIQLADLAAHTCAVMLAETLGFISKTVKAGENSGYEPDLDVELGFVLWAGIRFNFLSEPPPLTSDWNGSQDQLMANVQPYGLHISDGADEVLRNAGLRRFGRMYLGCIH